MFNIESLEVTKGSDEAYAGRGGAGGSINLISKTPHLGNSADGSTGLGTDHYRRFTADGNWQMADHAAFRLNVMSHNNDVAGRDMVNNERWGIAPSFTYGLGTPTRVTASYYHLDRRPARQRYSPCSTTWQADQRRHDLSGERGLRHNFYGLIDRDFRKTTSDVGTVRIEHDINNADLTIRNTTRYTKSTRTTSGRSPTTQPGQRRQRHGVAPVRTGRWQRLLDQERTVRRNSRPAPPARKLHHRPRTVAWKSLRRFVHRGCSHWCDLQDQGDGTASSLPACEPVVAESERSVGRLGQAGKRSDPAAHRTKSLSPIRYDRTRRHGRPTSACVSSRCSTDLRNTVANGDNTSTATTRCSTGQFGAVFIANGSVYASIATSSTPPGALLGQGSETQSLTPGRGGVGANADQLAPEKNRSIELGTKWNVLNNHLSLTGALFQIFDDQRTCHAAEQRIRDGRQQARQGSFGVAGQLTNKWQVFGGYTYMKSQLRDNGKTTSDNGHQFPNTPKNSISLWTNYDVLPKFTIGGGAFYMSQVYGDTANLRAVPSYWCASAAWRQYRILKKIDLQLNVQNIFNRTYYDQAYPAYYVAIVTSQPAPPSRHSTRTTKQVMMEQGDAGRRRGERLARPNSPRFSPGRPPGLYLRRMVWRLSHANGIVEAQAVYGQYLLDGHGVERNAAEALTWFKHAARRDHPMAMNMLGRCYEHGWGTTACAEVAILLVPARGAGGTRLGHV